MVAACSRAGCKWAATSVTLSAKANADKGTSVRAVPRRMQRSLSSMNSYTCNRLAVEPPSMIIINGEEDEDEEESERLTRRQKRRRKRRAAKGKK